MGQLPWNTKRLNQNESHIKYLLSTSRKQYPTEPVPKGLWRRKMTQDRLSPHGGSPRRKRVHTYTAHKEDFVVALGPEPELEARR